ncbi:hypothetical protein C3747_96g80 [Trypanosoma cruzi]|uniref:C3H1-type domain-containing protein n=2 Tax=Trypanosoma cruzi TaxID=5693 RepID=Q4DAS7_TRYCC|nr:hypothetical protein, conserved [Trypanosoma cruzi]EAN89637.1 hypothetical protein, conserved [Trypanosoma cruzi]PWV07937.1 hypothetical protein C3747_96g80 [Trypanosoma cruzi]RNC59612.1 hypothetical protein TcCL_ESM02672 [Trypanosoma cruzi]|eukprot:XP_811488.1 hypothetical protein [Trypanosoma cruzi strain CL Brener]
MGRGKGRAKGIDVTKHFFQPTGPADRVLVQISPSHTLYVNEEDLSPTQGSEAALALKREGRMEGPMKLCANWRQGACLSHAACNNAHVVAYFNNSAAPMGNGNNGVTSMAAMLQRQRVDGSHSVSQQQQQQQHQSQHQHSFHAGTTSAESNRVTEHKSAATTTHSTLIPAPRSQQANRRPSSMAASSAPQSSPSASTAWGRNNAVGNGNQHGSYQPHQQQHHHQSHHHRQHYPQQQQQHEVMKQKLGASQSRGSRLAGHRIHDDIHWTPLNGIINEVLLESATQQQKGKSEGGHQDLPSIANHQNSNTTNRVDGPNFPFSGSLNDAVGDDTWVASTLAQTPLNTAIWYDGYAGLWEPTLSSGATTTARTEPTTLTAGENPVFLSHELNKMASAASHGEVWGSLSGSNGESTVSTNKHIDISSTSEALKSQLLRELVGAGGDVNDPSPAETQLRSSTHRNPSTSSASFAEAKNSSGLLSLLGGGGCDTVVNDRVGTPTVFPATPSRNAHTIQHLMSLLTTE